jgi:ankyrin repeat protein
MLDVGFPVAFPETSHGWTPLHNAAWAGDAELVDLLIERGHPLHLLDLTYHGTPLTWAIHCCVEDGRHPEGRYGRVVASLIDAGCPWDRAIYPTGNAEIDEALEARLGA